ncbi:MAG TPA: TIGR00282 family metallophosphoesterase [Caulobacteraceae bacterium]|nr:TIGR00282 family metallophosphoesterase [Caulobacteraceae bacterium]
MRFAFFGDVVGRAAREALGEHLPGLRRRLGLEFVAVNAENAAAGFGITEKTARELFAAGADCLTLGNHAWDQKEALTYIVREPRLIRPLNYPALSDAPGRGAQLIETDGGLHVLVINLLGRVHMEPQLDDPFAAVEHELAACPLGAAADAIIVDMHAEATSEKMAMGHFCDGRASLVVGTHSHVPTADHQILPGGTAYLTDAGACADYDSVIGNDKEEPLRRFTTRISGGRFRPAEGPATVCGVYVETDPKSGLARRIEPIRVGGRLSQTIPEVQPLAAPAPARSGA